MKKVLLLGGLGYIGSRVYESLVKKHNVYSVDLGLFSTSDYLPPNFFDDFRYCSKPFIQSFDVVILLAGHSSVPACKNNEPASVINNVFNFTDILNKLDPKQKFIYASSGSVYGSCGEVLAKEEDRLPEPLQSYDLQKRILDKMIEMWGKTYNYYGLRFGTVCGYSSNPRNELIINSMVKSAIEDKKVLVSNPHNWRAILGLDDLCKAMGAIIDKDDSNPGIYNLASFNAKIGQIGALVSNKYNAEYIETAGNSTYSFSLNIDKFCNEFNFHPQDTITSICQAAEKNDFSRVRDWNINY